MISAATLIFLKNLSENNHRDWFLDHKSEFEKAKSDVYSLTQAIIKRLAGFDPDIPSDLDPKNCVMRIYRDIRFSKDKTPYKTNFGIAISANGKNFKGPGYYIHIEPQKSFIAAGSWFPESEQLKAIRQEIDYNSADWNELLNEEGFKSAFGDLNTEGKLKAVPKGYSADHPDIEYLKLKSFTVTHAIPDAQLAEGQVVDNIAVIFEKVYPLMVFLRSAIS